MDTLQIRKSNHLVQRTMNKFTYKQNQLMAVLLGKYVNLNTDECIDTNISIEELRDVLSIKSEGGNAYERIRKAVEHFGEHGSVGIYSEKDGKPKWTWMPYFTKIEMIENNVEFQWNLNMKPYLIELKNNYTQYLANDYLKLHSIYSQNLYENLKSLENFERSYGKKPVIQLDELRRIFQVDGKKTYEDFRYLNVKILKKSVAEITEVTDLNVSYSTIKNGRKVVAIEFSIKRKDWNYTKKQMEGLPEWYNDTTETMPSKELLEEALAQQAALKKEMEK